MTNAERTGGGASRPGTDQIARIAGINIDIYYY